ncbi:DNA ligase 2 [Folsomia candida]|uniref:DNA ligase 2 n=1 Tax=Folsomia candida TaxID=158441 RepID=A0A226F5Z5_FOLCA|nr:DNA ligase 2 [Folsomia candida]
MRKCIVGKRRMQQLASRATLPKTDNTKQTIRSDVPVDKDNHVTIGNITGYEDIEPGIGSELDKHISDLNVCGDQFRIEEESEISEVEVEDIERDLKTWALCNAVNQSQFTALLKILSRHKCFEKIAHDCRSILKPISANIQITELPPGNYAHFGIRPYLQCLSPSVVPGLQINIDGLPIYESNNLNFWPVLGHFVSLEYDPFVIGVYCGDK